MSRAFVRESDDRPELPLTRTPAPALSPGAKNYLTAKGAERLSAELQRLVGHERPQLTKAADDPDAKRRLALLDQRINQLEQSLQSAEIVDVQPGNRETVRFGATVTIQRADGEKDSYRIVGVDEVDLDRGWVSWLSPIAKTLLHKRLGERVRFRFPSGEEDLAIVGIEYEDL